MRETLSNTAAPGSDNEPRRYLMFTLHAHLPYVIHHGTWPHGTEWLFEAAAECYLPLLRVLGALERDGIPLHCNLTLSPVLLEQLVHPEFGAEFPSYLQRKIAAAREDEAFFLATDQAAYAELARFWESFFTQALHDYEALGGNIVGGFRALQDRGVLEIITCCATHGYLPLLGTDESVRAQTRLAVTTHTRHFGKAPRGIWVPECGYRPQGMWSYPAWPDGGTAAPPATSRIGVEEALRDAGLEFFVVDTHLVEDASAVNSPYARRGNSRAGSGRDPHSLYRPWAVRGSSSEGGQSVSIFARDPHTGLQVWSAENGYPGDFEYLDFHKKRWPGGHRYWRVSGTNTDMGDKQIYSPEAARGRVQAHAEHFVELVQQTLQAAGETQIPPVLCAPFDAELFGHWWFEGPQWLEAVARCVYARAGELALTGGGAYLDRFRSSGEISLREGSWGAGGGNDVWLNPETRWTYNRIYPSEIYVREVCTAGRWRSGGPVAERIVKQLCRELLLMESSDWQFLITTGAARDYAEARFKTHADLLDTLKWIWESFEGRGELDQDQTRQLETIETRDDIFREIHPDDWAIQEPEEAAGVTASAAGGQHAAPTDFHAQS